MKRRFVRVPATFRIPVDADPHSEEVHCSCTLSMPPGTVILGGSRELGQFFLLMEVPVEYRYEEERFKPADAKKVGNMTERVFYQVSRNQIVDLDRVKYLFSEGYVAIYEKLI